MQAHKLDMLDFFKSFAVSPDDLPDIVFASIGRTVWRDIGATAVCFRLVSGTLLSLASFWAFAKSHGGLLSREQEPRNIAVAARPKPEYS